MVLQVVQKFSQAAPDTEFDPSESELMLRHTRSSCRLGIPLESSVGKIRVVASMRLEI